MSYDRTKRMLDLAIAVPALLLSLPIQAAVACAIARRLGRPVLFRQPRPGLAGKPFVLLKFRTMRPLDPDRGWIDDDSRMTALGRRLRASSLDELPSLWNVVRGDLSLVGPRPLLVEYLNRYTPEQMRRHDVKPGLTGLAQVSGRNAITWDQKFALDIKYLENQSFRTDIRIILATARSVLRRDGIHATGSQTMPEFLASGG